MQIKFELSAKQLDSLHAEIIKPENKYFEESDSGRGQHKYFVWIASVEGAGKEMFPVPTYKVVIYATETYCKDNKEFKTPMARLQSVLQAIGLFPSEDGVEFEAK